MEDNPNKGMQQDEMESLQSIFMDEFLLLNESPLTYELIILADPEDSAEEHGVKARLRVEYTEKYPDEVPIVSAHVQHPLTIKDLEKIKEITDTTCAGLIGMPMIYEVSEKIKDHLVHRKKETNKEVYEEEKQKAEQKKSDMEKMYKAYKVDHEITTFTPVAPETYNKWRQKVEAKEKEEYQKKSPSEKKAVSIEEMEKRVTGRQFFELKRQQLMKKAVEAGVTGAAEQKEGEDVFYYDEEAFEDIGDVEDVELS